MAGIRRTLGVAPRARKRPMSTEDRRSAVHAMGDRMIDVRDRAVLLVGYAGGPRPTGWSRVASGDSHSPLTSTSEGLGAGCRCQPTGRRRPAPGSLTGEAQADRGPVDRPRDAAMLGGRREAQLDPPSATSRTGWPRPGGRLLVVTGPRFPRFAS